MYDIQPEASDDLRRDERDHARLLAEIHATSSGGIAGEALARVEGRHRGLGGNALRAAVLGANDGLVSNLSLVMGVAGAELARGTILVTGLAGLLAGALSMAMGEWISVQSSRELYAHQIDVERFEIATHARGRDEGAGAHLRGQGTSAPRGAGARKADHERRGYGARRDGARGARHRPRRARRLCRRRRRRVVRALHGRCGDTVLPFAFLSGTAATVASIAASAAGLFLLGTAITLLTHRGVLRSGTRQLLIGLAAACITFAIGRLVGVGIA